MRRFRFTPIVLAFAALALPLAAFAQSNGFVPLADTSQSPLISQAYNSGNLVDFVNTLFRMAISLGAILAVVRIAWAGYQYMTTDSFGSKSHAKEVLGDVALGLLLLLSIWLILYQINPDLLNLTFLKDITPIQQ